MNTSGPTLYTVRECAKAIIDSIDKCEGGNNRFLEQVRGPLQKLLDRPDLLTLGVKREGNHIDFSRYLYYDGQLSITLDQFPKDKVIPPHDHGVWELLAIYRGRVAHTIYERRDDCSVLGYADLLIVDERVLDAQDLALVAPPAEIHGFTALDEDTYSVTVVGGHYKPQRHYFDPRAKSCIARTPRLREPPS